MREVVQNYHNYLTGLVRDYSNALQSAELNDEAKGMVQAAIQGVETELKFVTYRLTKLTPVEAEVVSSEEDGLRITRTVS